MFHKYTPPLRAQAAYSRHYFLSKAVFPLAKFSMIMPATVTRDSTCLDHLGRCIRDRIISIFCCNAQGGQGKYSICLSSIAVADVFASKLHHCIRALTYIRASALRSKSFTERFFWN